MFINVLFIAKLKIQFFFFAPECVCIYTQHSLLGTLVDLHIHAIVQSAGRVPVAQCIKHIDTSRELQLMLTSKLQYGETCGRVVGARRAKKSLNNNKNNNKNIQ